MSASSAVRGSSKKDVRPASAPRSFSPRYRRKGTKRKLCCHDLLQWLLNVEVELKYVLSYLPFGVFTRPQLKRELKRCVELGEPWPFVLAVIPSSGRQSKLS